MTKRSPTAFLALLATTSLLAACGSDDDKGSTATTTAASEAEPAASYEIVSDAEVAKGYADLLAKMTTLAADPSSVDSSALDDVEAIWFSFEGTVKETDPDSYLASEEALDSFNSAGEGKDAAGMTAATTKMSTTAATYLAAHPG